MKFHAQLCEFRKKFIELNPKIKSMAEYMESLNSPEFIEFHLAEDNCENKTRSTVSLIRFAVHTFCVVRLKYVRISMRSSAICCHNT